MTGRAHIIGRAAGLVGLVILAMLPLLVQLPTPDALTIDQASFALDGAAPQSVSLPHSWPRDISAGLHEVEYRLTFTLRDEEERERAQYLLIPLTRLTPHVQLNGQDLFVVHAQPWAAPLYEMPHLARLPENALELGTNVLSVHMTREGGFRIGYLAAAYLGTSEQILPNYRLLAFLVDLQRIGVLALYILLTIGVAGLWLARRDAVYGWFCLMGVSLTLTNLASMNPFDVLRAGISSIVVTSVGSFSSMILFGLACAMVGRQRPRWLIPVAFSWSAVILVALMVYPYFRPLGVAFVFVSIGWLVATALALRRAFRATRNKEFALVMMGIEAIIFYVFVDAASIAGVYDRGAILLLYPQIFLITGLAVILFRRLTQSLDTLDAANETMRIGLNEQQEELARAHAHETQLSADIAREQERQRLTRDLHDGLSGHIVSIIAQAENAENPDIEKTAREALDDLRLVIQSLDIGDEDIPVALAYFRERVSLQLRRLNIAMEWSMDRLPAIAGVTPGHALALLRILQEAVTNAIKHGPAQRITVTGERAEDGSARITVENDGRSDLPTTSGNGLGNMRQRAASLGGGVTLDPLSGGMRLTVSLPCSLPALESVP
ncbi:ATP-binding protein [Devosia sp.]|uniref:sensor histidine kinase n=1 Tax=Devosia sp. TaxID=1871048 RepID=UPI0019FD52B6|nr:ATP-binding protein [Devosia sp.]MBE0580111.1 hypothetical protein [Devosia sp.]